MNAAQEVRFTLFDDAKAQTLTELAWPWQTVVDTIKRPRKYKHKAKCKLIKFARFGTARTEKNCLRFDDNMIAVSGIEGDYDGERVDVADAVVALGMAGVRCVVYTSPSHKPDAPRWRVIAPLSKEYPPTERARFVARINGVLRGILAPESFAASQSFYVGEVEGTAYEAHAIDGEFVDLLDALDAGALGKIGGDAAADGESDDATDTDLRAVIATGAGGEGVHKSSSKLAARLLGRGMEAGDVLETLRGMLNAAAWKAGEPARWQERFDDLPRIVRDAAAFIDRRDPEARARARAVAAVPETTVVLDLDAKATHSEIAAAMVDFLRRRTCGGNAPVGVAGDIYLFEPASGCWKAHGLDYFAALIGPFFIGNNYKRLGDYRAVANIIYCLNENPRFFIAAPVGVAADGKFYSVDDSGTLRKSALTPNHRARFLLRAAPDAACAAPKFKALLAAAFDGSDAAEQIKLVRQQFGAGVTGMMARMQKVALWKGKTAAGKSTLQTINRAMYREDDVCSVAPSKWNHEYHAAALAGKRLNIVGEIDSKEPLDVSFKKVTGCDLVGARHPTHRPFSFVCDAAHFFNCNGFPATLDRSDAFFRRWSIVVFRNTFPEETADSELAESVVRDELAYVTWWALTGAGELVQSGGRFIETAAHKATLTEWRNRADSVFSFLLDVDCIELRANATEGSEDRADAARWSQVARRDLRLRYKSWCGENDMRALGIAAYNESLDRFMPLYRMTEDTATRRLTGVRFNPAWSPVRSRFGAGSENSDF